MKQGKSYQDLSYPVVPRTEADAERIQRRGEKTKEVLFQDLKSKVMQARLVYSSDRYLNDMEEYLRSKNSRYFSPKSKLVQLVTEVEGYIDNLVFERERIALLISGESEDEDDVSEIEIEY